MTAAYIAYAVGSFVLSLGILARPPHQSLEPGLGRLGGTLTLLGLFDRTFSTGVEHLAFQMVRVEGRRSGRQGWSLIPYRAFQVFRFLNLSVMLGWLIVAFGAYRSGTLGLIRSMSLGLMAMCPFSTLKGTEIRSAVLVGLCLALTH